MVERHALVGAIGGTVVKARTRSNAEWSRPRQTNGSSFMWFLVRICKLGPQTLTPGDRGQPLTRAQMFWVR